jgi:hypothetical protein
LFAAIVASDAIGQTIIQNTRLRDHVAIPSTSWAAGNTGYRTANRRYLLQTLGVALAIVDVTDPDNATVIRTITNISVKEVKVWRNYAYASTDNGPTRVIDLTNPATAAVVNSITNGTHTMQIDPLTNRLYMNRAGQNQVQIRDLAANPVNPPILATIPIANHDSHPRGNRLFVAGGSPSTCYIYDVSALPATPLIASFPVPGGYLHDVDLYRAPNGQEYLYASTELSPQTWMHIFDITNPSAATMVGQWWTAQSSTIHNVFLHGAYAFVSYYKDGLRVLDLTNPASPQQVGIFDPNPTNVGGTFEGTWDVYPYHEAVYMDEMFDTSGPVTQGAWIVDFFPGYGNGCPGTAGVVPTQWWAYGPPAPGNSDFVLKLDNARPNAPAVLIIGFSNTTWTSFALPLNLAVFGGNGCTLYQSPDSVSFITTDANGRAAQALPVPAAFAGLLWSQWGVFDAGAPNAAQLATTNGGKLIVQ